MASEKEVFLMNQNQQLKKRIRDMEELFASQDENSRERLEELMQQKKDVTSKNTALESRVFGLVEENTELKELLEKLSNAPAQQQRSAEPESNPLSESFVNEFTGLQDKVDELNEEKITLQSTIRELQNEIVNMVQRLESLESTNANLTDALSSVNKEKMRLCKENKHMAESVTMMQMQIDTMSIPVFNDQKERGNSLFGEVQEELEQTRKRNAELEQEVGVLRKTLASHGDDDRRKMKDVECMRESLKAISEKNKQLQKELDKKMDIEAEHAALKTSAIDVDRENERLKAENNRLKKQFNAAESRADENAHLLSKAETARINMQLAVAAESRVEQDAHLLSNATVSQVEFFKHRTASQSTPRPILKHRTASLPRVNRVPSSSSTVKTETLPPKDTPAVRKRGILLDFSEPVNRKRLDFKVQKLSENNRDRQMHHLKSHYDPVTGAYDQSHGESPKTAARLTTPTKGNSFLTSIFRR